MCFGLKTKKKVFVAIARSGFPFNVCDIQVASDVPDTCKRRKGISLVNRENRKKEKCVWLRVESGFLKC